MRKGKNMQDSTNKSEQQEWAFGFFGWGIDEEEEEAASRYEEAYYKRPINYDAHCPPDRHSNLQ